MGEHRQEEELPLTPAMIATLGDGQAQTTRTAVVATVGAAVIFSCLGIIMNNRASWIQSGLLLVATAYAALLVVLYKGRNVRLDREFGRYVRLMGGDATTARPRVAVGRYEQIYTRSLRGPG